MDLGCRTVTDYVGSRKQAWFLESLNDGAGGKDFRYEGRCWPTRIGIG